MPRLVRLEGHPKALDRPRKLGGPLLSPESRRAIAYTVLGAGVMGVAVGLTRAFMEPGWIRLTASVAVGATSFAALSAALRRPELRWLLVSRV